MKNKVLFVGDCHEYLADAAKKFDPLAILINHENHEHFIKEKTKWVGYTSLGDLPKDLSIFNRLISIADQIFYCPPKKWSDNKHAKDATCFTDSIQGLTEFYLYSTHKLHSNVSGLETNKFDVDQYLELKEKRKIDSICLWVAGCSTTDGVGVLPEERYGHLLEKKLNLPAIFLTKPASSISWAADQILRSDIRAGDIVVWGLTNEHRLFLWDPYYKNMADVKYDSKNKFGFSSRTIGELQLHETNLAIAIQQIDAVKNFCQKTNSKLLLVNIHSSIALNLHLIPIKEFFLYICETDDYIDTGNDGLHPGPKQHQDYANFCYQALTKLQYI